MLLAASLTCIAGIAVVLANGLEATDGRPSPCSTTGFADPVYRVTLFHYDRNYRLRSPDGIDAGLTFDVTDVANNYTVRCKASQFLDENKPAEQRTCFEEGSSVASPPTLDFNYVFASGRFSLRQSWACERENGSFPTVWQALGNTTLTSQPSCVNTSSSTPPPPWADYGHKFNCTVADTDIPTVRTSFRRIPVTRTSRSVALAAPPRSQVRRPPDNDSPCIGRSFTYPNWRVHNLTDSGNGAHSLTLESRALLRQVRCRTDGNQWTRCDDSATTERTLVRVQTTPLEVFVDQSWTCPDVTGDVQIVRFHATGSAAMRDCLVLAPTDGSGKNTSCSTGPVTVRGVLDEPVHLKPKPPAIPPHATATSCRSLSRNVSWELRDLKYEQAVYAVYGLAQYNSSTQKMDHDHSQSVFSGRLRFNASNHANGFLASLKMEGAELNEYNGSAHGGQFAFLSSRQSGFETVQVMTNVTFDPATKTLGLSQSWVCYEDDQDSNLIRFEASGRVVLPSECTWTNRTWVNNWFIGFPRGPDPGPYPPVNPIDGYVHGWEANCTPNRDSLVVPGVITSETALSPLEAVEPRPTGFSCTIASLLATQWSFRRGWHLTTNLVNQRSGGGFFALIHHGRGRDRQYEDFTFEDNRLSPGHPDFDPDTWYESWLGGDAGPAARQQFQIDLTSGVVAINETWLCDDKDPDHPIKFTATGMARFPLSMNCTLWPADRETWVPEEWIKCEGPGDSGVIAASSITWEAQGSAARV